MFKNTVDSLTKAEGLAQIEKVKRLTTLAETRMFIPPNPTIPLKTHLSFIIIIIIELGCSVTHLALAWVATNPNTSTVILGASRPEQVTDNLKALAVIPKLTPAILETVEEILGNKPELAVCVIVPLSVL